MASKLRPKFFSPYIDEKILRSLQKRVSPRRTSQELEATKGWFHNNICGLSVGVDFIHQRLLSPIADILADKGVSKALLHQVKEDEDSLFLKCCFH